MDMVSRNNGSTRSIANVKSHLRVHCRLSSLGWMDEAGQARLLLLERSLRFEDYGSGQRKRPLVMALLTRLFEMLALEIPTQLQLATTLAVGHNGLLRGGELWSRWLVEDVIWHGDGLGFGLQLGRTKTHRTGGPVTITYRSFDRKVLSAVNLMRRWFDIKGLWGRQKDLVFPGFRYRGGECFEDEKAEGNKRTWIKFFRSYLSKLGCDSKEYAGHSLRAGGATDLFNSGMTMVSIMKVGRWKTVEAALLYFRDDMVIAEEVAKFFAQLGGGTSKKEGSR